MSSGVVTCFAFVVTSRDDVAVTHYNGTNWYIASIERETCFFKRNTHGCFVG
jgi:hypothetical protein